MAFITLAGTLRDPTSELAVGDQIRFTHKSTTGETVEGAVSVLTIDPSGTYSKDLQYGLVLVEYKDVRTSQFKNLGVATVNDSNPATSIPELLNALVPVSSAELIEFQAILADAVTARDEAEAFAASIDLINDLSQAYIFDTVAEYKASAIVFPMGKTVHLNDRDADFAVIAGTGTATGYGVIASSSVSQSITIINSNGIAYAKAYGADLTGVDDGTPATQEALQTLLPVDLGFGTLSVTQLVIPSNCPAIYGKGMVTASTKIKHRTGATGHMIVWESPNRVINIKMSNFYMEGNSEIGERSGLDLTGFSYSNFENIYSRLFKEDGIFGDGSITPINQQISNNTFKHVRLNNNFRDGLRLEALAGARNENTANTFIGCEFAGNYGWQVNELAGECNVYEGCVAQSAVGLGEIKWDYVRSNSWNGYVEGSSKAVTLTANSQRNSVSTRSSFPLWNTFDDSGEQNQTSIRGESTPEKLLFENMFFTKWLGVNPEGIAPNGAISFSSYTDTGSIYKAGLNVTLNANFQGLILTLLDPELDLRGKWVTLIAEIETSGVSDDLQSRLVTRNDTTQNSSAGEFAPTALRLTGSSFKTVHYDVRFTEAAGSVKDIIWYLAYSGLTTSNVVKIRNIRVVYGQTSNSSAPFADTSVTNIASTATLQNKSLGINIHRKLVGTTVIESSTGKLRYAIGSSDTSAWRATDGSGDVTPS